MRNISTVLTSIIAFFIAAACTPTINPVLPEEKTEVEIEVGDQENQDNPEIPAPLPMNLSLEMNEAVIFPENNPALTLVGGKGLDIPFTCSEVTGDFRYELQLGNGLSGNITFSEKDSAGKIHIDCAEPFSGVRTVGLKVSGTYEGTAYEWSEIETVSLSCADMKINGKSSRDVFYNGCKIFCLVSSSTPFELEFMDGCEDWISVVEDKSDLSKGELWFQIDALPEVEEEEGEGEGITIIIGGDCTKQDRSGTIRIWDKSHQAYLTYTVNQLCFGCSGGFEMGDDVIVSY